MIKKTLMFILYCGLVVTGGMVGLITAKILFPQPLFG